MIEVINALQRSEYYNVSENVEIAKGKYELVSGWKAILRKAIRRGKFKKR